MDNKRCETCRYGHFFSGIEGMGVCMKKVEDMLIKNEQLNSSIKVYFGWERDCWIEDDLLIIKKNN